MLGGFLLASIVDKRSLKGIKMNLPDNRKLRIKNNLIPGQLAAFFTAILLALFTLTPLYPAQTSDSEQGEIYYNPEEPSSVLSAALEYFFRENDEKAEELFLQYISMHGEEEVPLRYLTEISISRKDFTTAEKYILKALRIEPKDITLLGLAGHIYINQDRLDDAIEVYYKISELDPANIESLYTLAQIYQHQKKDSTAAIYYKKMALAAEREHGYTQALLTAYVQLANYYYNIANFPTALFYYNKSVELNPKNRDALFIQGELYKLSGQFEKCAQVMHGLLAGDQYNVEVLQSLAESVFVLQRIDARAVIQQYHRVSENPLDDVYIAMELYYDKKYEEAVELFNAVLSDTPNRLSAHIGIYQAGRHLKDADPQKLKEEAYKIATLAHRVGAEYIALKYMHEVFRYLDKEGKGDDIETFLYYNTDNYPGVKVEGVISDLIESYMMTAYIHDARGSMRLSNAYRLRANQFLGKLIRLYDANPELFQDYEGEKLSKKKYENRYEWYKSQKAEVLINYSWQNYFFQQSKKGDPDLIPYMDEVIGLTPEDSRGYFVKGLILYSQDEKVYAKEANLLFQKSLETFQEFNKGEPPPEYYFYLGVTNEKIGKFDEMEKNLIAALEAAPENPIFLNYLGYHYSQKDMKLDIALRYIKKALDIDPENSAFLDSLGWIYYKMGDYEEALGHLLLAKTLADKEDRNDAVVSFHIAETYYQLGFFQQAKRFYLEALEHKEDASEDLNEAMIQQKIRDIDDKKENSN